MPCIFSLSLLRSRGELSGLPPDVRVWSKDFSETKRPPTIILGMQTSPGCDTHVPQKLACDTSTHISWLNDFDIPSLIIRLDYGDIT